MEHPDRRETQRLLEAFYRDPTESTFLPLYESTKHVVYTLCRRILQCEEDATDAFQSTYCRLVAVARRGGCAKEARDASATVYRLAVREAHNLRQRRRRRLRREVAMQIDGLPNSQSQPDETAADRQQGERVEALVSALPERYRLPVLLHFFHGLTYAEIAQTLDVPPGTVSSRIGRALTRLTPILRRAGLAESATILGAVAATSHLLAPPARLDASAVFAKAEAALAAGGAAATLGSFGGSAATATGTSTLLTSLGVGLAKAKTAAIAATLAVATVGVIAVAVVQSEKESEEPQVVVSPDGEDASSSSTVQPAEGGAAEPTVGDGGDSSDAAAATSVFGVVWIPELNQPAADAEVYVPTTEISVVADQEGNFRIDRVDGAEIKLAAKSGRYRTHGVGEWGAVEPLQLEQRVANGPHRILLKRIPVFTGVVRDLETGGPIVGAEVAAWSSRKALTDATGTYLLPGVIGPGETDPATLTVSAEGYVLARVKAERAGEDDITHNFDLEPGADVLVRVVDDDGEPVEGARIGMTVGWAYLPTEVRTDAAGEAVIGGISRTQPRELEAEKEGYTRGRKARPRFADDDSTPEVTLVLHRYELETGVYTGRVTNSAGEPLADMEVRVRYADKTNLHRHHPVKTDDDGRYRVELENPKSEFFIVAGGQGYAPESRAGVRPGSEEEPTEVDFALEPGHWLEGVVVDENDAPLSGVEIQVDGLGEAEKSFILFGESAFVQTDRDGRFRVEGAPPAGVSLHPRVKGRASPSKDFEVDQEVRVVLRHAGVIRGRVIDEATGEPVTGFTVRNLHDLHKKPGTAVHSTDGRFTIDDDLDVGEEYVVRVEAAHYLAAVAEAVTARPADEAEEVVMTLSRGEELSGKIVEAEAGVPLSEVTVVYGFEKSGFSWGYIDAPEVYNMLDDVQRTVTGRDGVFRFVEGDRQGAIYIKAAGFLPVRIESKEREKYTSENGEVAVSLKPGGSISGAFFFERAPKAEATIQVSDGWVRHGPVTTDAQGRYRIDGVPGGTYKVEARVRSPWYRMIRKVKLMAREAKTLNLGDDLGPLSISGRVLHGNVAPRERGHVTVEPLFEWDYVKFVVSTDDEGSYRVGGLVPGKYKLRGGADVGGGQRNLSRTIDLRHDADQDFIFDDNHRVRARLVFPGGTSAEMIARARQVGLAAVDDATDGEAQRTGAIDRYASAEVNGGDVTFKGRFQGAYRVQVEFYENGVGESDVKLPQPILLDNLEGDQDAGDLELPAVGWIDLSLADASAAGTLPEYGSIVLVPAGKQRTYDNATHLYLRPPKSNETIGPIAAGTYEWAANVWGFQCAPVWSTVTVRPGGSTPLQVNLRPEGVLHFVVQIGKGTVPFKRVTLSGPALEESGGTRILEPDSSTAGSRRLTTGDYRDHIGGASFTFHNLPQGDYELTVEVEGYVTWRESRSVVPGQGRREDIQLRPRVE